MHPQNFSLRAKQEIDDLRLENLLLLIRLQEANLQLLAMLEAKGADSRVFVGKTYAEVKELLLLTRRQLAAWPNRIPASNTLPPGKLSTWAASKP